MKIVLIYAGISALYILLSDSLLHLLLPDPDQISRISILKGWVFVALTAALLYKLISDLIGQGTQALNSQAQGYRDLAEHSPAIIYQASIDSESKTTYISPQVSELGYSPEEWIKTPDLWLQLIHPEDVERVLAEVEKSHTTGETFSTSYRLKDKRGAWRYFHDEARVILDIEGNPLYLQGMMLDITELKNAEHELRIAATAFDSQDAMFITDEDHLILRVNHAFTIVTGYSAAEVIGQNPRILSSGRQDGQFYKALWDTLNRNDYWHGEIWNKRKNGEVYPEWLSITAVRDESGKLINYVAAFTDITDFKKAEEKIHNLSFYDDLTGLPNRRLLLERLKQTLRSTARKSDQGAILFIDIDDFKSLNDTLGHELGDLLLVEVAKRIQSCVHQDDTVARLGSDEFVVVVETLGQDTKQAGVTVKLIAERIHAEIKKPVDLNGHEYHCKACIGISLFRDHETRLDELLKHADSAMFQAKQSGRDKIHFFDESMQAALEERVLLEAALRRAMPEQLQLHYQLQVDANGRPFGAEALVRWLHPERGMISPAAFIPMAEETGMILPLGQWVLETACKQIKAWEASPSTRHLQIAVNVSARQFHQFNFVETVLSVLESTGADPSRLKLELTESLLVEDIEAIILKMTKLKSRGVSFSLDDFGTGYSSLTYLKRLPVDQLKIDQSFVRDVLIDPNDAAIARTVIALGQSLGFSVIAEGVETEAQRNFLAVNGCHQYQGYLFSKPIPIMEFEALLLKGAQ